MKKQSGLSLIELMVAILISSILILGVTELFSTTLNTDRTNTALSRVQESGRLALEMMGADARRAGYVGCINNSPIRGASAVNLSAEAPIQTEVGSLTFPAAAVDSTPTSITFRYGVLPEPGSTAPLLPAANPTCAGEQLELRATIYANCNTSSICLNGDPILDNAEISGISFGVSTGTENTEWVDGATITAAQRESAHLVRLEVTINETNENITRTFSGTYNLRNRM